MHPFEAILQLRQQLAEMADLMQRLDRADAHHDERLHALERRTEAAERLMADLITHMSRINVHLTSGQRLAEEQGLALDRIAEDVRKTLELLQPKVIL